MYCQQGEEDPSGSGLRVWQTQGEPGGDFESGALNNNNNNNNICCDLVTWPGSIPPQWD